MTQLHWRWETQVSSLRMRTAGYLRRSPGRGPCQPKKNKTPKHDSREFILLGGLAEDYRPEDSLPSALRNCPTDGEEVSMHAIVVKGWRADKLTSWEKVAENQEERMSLWKILELFYPWEVVKLGSSIFSGNYLTIRRPVVSVFPEHRGPRSWSQLWTPIRVWWRSGSTAVGRDFILQNLMWNDVFIVILKEKHQNSCGERVLPAFSLFLSSQERSRSLNT